MSVCKFATKAPKNAVKAPQKSKAFSIFGENSKKIEQRTIRKTPAVTSVAACIRAETGVGPSIASGNHVCNPNCADLLAAARAMHKEIAEYA